MIPFWHTPPVSTQWWGNHEAGVGREQLLWIISCKLWLCPSACLRP